MIESVTMTMQLEHSFGRREMQI